MGKRLGQLSLYFAGLTILGITCVLLINQMVKTEGSRYLVDAGNAPAADAILVLGALVKPDGNPSDMLHDRLQTALELYHRGVSDKILVSGDHGRVEYDEVNAMRSFLEERGVEPDRIFMDHAGFSTYESVYRARDIFQVEKVVVVTQEYHLMRAVYMARKLGLEAYGVASDLQTYRGMPKFELREIAARNKDFLMVNLFKAKPAYLGDAIPITSDGRLTRDK